MWHAVENSPKTGSRRRPSTFSLAPLRAETGREPRSPSRTLLCSCSTGQFLIPNPKDSASCPHLTQPQSARRSRNLLQPSQKFQDLLRQRMLLSNCRKKRASCRAIAELLTKHCLPSKDNGRWYFATRCLAKLFHLHRHPGRKRPLASTPLSAEEVPICAWTTWPDDLILPQFYPPSTPRLRS